MRLLARWRLRSHAHVFARGDPYWPTSPPQHPTTSASHYLTTPLPHHLIASLEPDLPSAYWLRCLNCVHHRDHRGAVDALHRYFDFAVRVVSVDLLTNTNSHAPHTHLTRTLHAPHRTSHAPKTCFRLRRDRHPTTTHIPLLHASALSWHSLPPPHTTLILCLQAMFPSAR